MDVLSFGLGLGIGMFVAVLILWRRRGVSSPQVGEEYVPRAWFEQAEQRLAETEQRARAHAQEHIELHAQVAAQREKIAFHQQTTTQQQEREAQWEKRLTQLTEKLFHQQSQEFSQTSRHQLDDLLAPLHAQLEAFEQKINHHQLEDTKQRSALRNELQRLYQLNQRITQETHALTEALKGDTRTQGNWGELILERVLEASGLRKGEEYHTQTHFTTTDGRRQRPDVILHLPDNKQLVIDAKVSLTAYERYCNATNHTEQQKELQAHIQSLRQHIRGLSQKRYEQLHKLQTPEFVLLFVPIEGAFSLAMQSDSELFYEAFEQNIVVVSPTTLLATTRTVASLWKQAKQNQNALEIARRGGLLYDKFVNFVGDLREIEQRLNQAQTAQQNALRKLKEGKGSLIRQTELLRELGAKNSRQLPNL